jgi:uncharacterized protein YbaR (Trm112 family)
MDALQDEIVMCPYCHQPMQLAHERFNGKGEVIQKQYICGCQGVAYFKNIHAIKGRD